MKKNIVVFKDEDIANYDIIHADTFDCNHGVLMLYDENGDAIVAYKDWIRMYEYVEKEKEASEE